MGHFQILSEEEIQSAVDNLLDWEMVNGSLEANYVFKDFKTAFSFITIIALESEKINHHPGWSNTYNKVHFSLATHDVGNKVTDVDIKMADYISKVSQQFLT